MNDPSDDAKRLAAVQRYQILDTPPDGAFDRITAIAARLFQVPIALVTVVDRDRIWFKSRHGLAIEQIDREPGLCASAILQHEVYVIANALQDPRALTNSLVRGEFGLRFYAAAPLTTQDGYNLGTLCIIDRQPRQLTADETQTLADLAAVVMDELELRLSARQLVATTTAQRAAIDNLYNNAPCGYHSLDENGVFLAINDTKLGWLGYDREAVVGHLRFSEVLTPASQATFAANFPQFKRQGRIDDLEFELVRADGSTQWILISAIAEYDEQGNYVSSRSTAYNISDRKRAELALRQLNQTLETKVAERTAELGDRNAALEASNQALHLSNQRFHNAFDYAGIGMALVGLEGQWLAVNRSLCDITGYSEAELLATTFQAITHPDDLDTDLDLVRQLLNQEMRHYHLEKRYRHQQGHWVWIMLSVSLVTDEQQVPLYFVSQIQDINDRIALEDRLRQAQRLESLGQLTGGIAHDFNNLLTVIIGIAELLTETLDPDSTLRPLAEMVNSAAQRGADLTQRLLAFARRQVLDPKPVDVNQLMATMTDLLGRTLGEHIEVVRLPADDLWPALVDPAQLENALLNLCLNARDAMAQGGELIVETSNVYLDQDYADEHAEAEAGQYVLITVSDSGVGIAPDDLPHVFEPFFTTKETGKGTGLGLSMVYGFAKQSNGHITIYSELGQGTMIRLYLPRYLGDEGDFSEIVPMIGAVGGKEWILLVEDDDLVRSYVQNQLEQMGYRVTAASSGPAALAILQQQPEVDLLFTDVVMPGGMSGRELGDAARRLRPDLKILYTSGYSEQAIVHHGRLDHGVKLLSKPYRRDDLAQKVRDVLGESVSGQA